MHFSAPPCKAHTEGLQSESRLPCARGAGTAVKDKNAVTEGLYPPTGYSVYTFRSLPRSFVTKRKAVFFLNAVPDGVPNGVFSIYLFRSAILTARRLFRTDKATLQGKRYNRNPLRRRGGTSPKGEGAEALENGVNAFHTAPQSFRLAYKPKIQLPLHSWLSSAAGGGYNEKGKLLPSASARANSRSTSG